MHLRGPIFGYFHVLLAITLIVFCFRVVGSNAMMRLFDFGLMEWKNQRRLPYSSTGEERNQLKDRGRVQTQNVIPRCERRSLLCIYRAQ